MSAPRTRPASLERILGEGASATLRDSAKVILWGLVLYATVQWVGNRLAAKAMGSLAAQVVIAEWGAGRLGVAWSDPLAPVATFGSILRRALRGAGIGALAAALVVAFAIATGAMTTHRNRPELGDLAIGVIGAVLVAARDELLFRGVVIRAFRRTCPTMMLLAICGCAAAAAEYGARGANLDGNVPRIVVAALLGIAFAAFWLRDRGAWLAAGAHAGWSFTTGTAIGGGLFDLRASSTLWGGGDAGLAGSAVAIAALVPLAALAVGWSRGGQKTVGSTRHVGH